LLLLVACVVQVDLKEDEVALVGAENVIEAEVDVIDE